jgi:uncharacterized protein (DUF58 family)
MSRPWLLIGLIYLLFFLSLVTLNGAYLALALPLMAYLLAALLFGPDELQLTVRRTLHADRYLEDTPLTVHLTLSNQGSLLERVWVEDVLPPDLSPAEGATSLLTSLAPGQSASLEYTVHARRGSFDFNPVQVTASDTLSLFRRQVTLSAPTHISILPNVPRLRRLAIRPFRTRGTAGPIPARVGGTGVDFYGIREYQLGDPRRRINWRVSARHPRSLFTNEYEQERIADVGLILDARSETDVCRGRDSLFEHAVRATAALAQHFLNEGNRVGLLVYGRTLDWTFPGYGRVQRERILQALARAQTGESQIFDKLEYLPTRYFPAQSQLVLVSPLSREDAPPLVRLRARGYQILIIRPDPISFELAALPADAAVDLAKRILRVEQRLLRQKLLQAGIQVVEWQVDQPFDQAVHASLGRMPHWFRAVGLEP